MRVDEALRAYLKTFTLPGEGQIVDRIMQKFADKFTKDNPNSSISANGCYTLCYLLMMLQTSLHNPQVPKEDRMDYKQFLNLSKGINDGKDFSSDFMSQLFKSVKAEPLAVHELERQQKQREKTASLTLKKKLDLFKEETQ